MAGSHYSTGTRFRLAAKEPTHIAIGNQKLLQRLSDLTVAAGTVHAAHAFHQGSGAEVERLPCVGPAAHERRMGGQDLILVHLVKLGGGETPALATHGSFRHKSTDYRYAFCYIPVLTSDSYLVLLSIMHGPHNMQLHWPTLSRIMHGLLLVLH